MHTDTQTGSARQAQPVLAQKNTLTNESQSAAKRKKNF